MKIHFYTLFALLAFSTHLHSQDAINESIISKIDLLFDAMRTNDSTLVGDLFTEGSTLSSIIVNTEGKVFKRTNPAAGFVSAIGKPREAVWNEKIWSYDIHLDGPMAYVWTEYTFYLDDMLSHCGVNMFELMKTEDGWKISAITDTRRKTDCKTDPVLDINSLLDNWHKAAAEADENVFFGSMAEQSIYIGTDATERWKRDEMKSWAKEYFERDSAWSFNPISRTVEIGMDGKTAWIDELLETWMGICRASGVVIKQDEGWKIQHYHLSIAVPNEKVDAYLDLIGKTKK